MLKTRTYILLAVVVYLVTVLASLPASLITSRLEQQLGSRLQVHSVSGTVWAGSIQAESQGHSFAVDWDIKALNFLWLELASEVYFRSRLGDFKGNVALSYKRIEIERLEGEVNGPELSRILKASGAGVSFDKNVRLQGVSLERSSGEFRQASGKALWDGGVVKVDGLPAGEVELPALEANLGISDQGIMLVTGVASESGKPLSLVDIDLSHGGRAHLRLRERVAEYVEIPKQLKQGQADAVMFEIKREVFQAEGLGI